MNVPLKVFQAFAYSVLLTLLCSFVYSILLALENHVPQPDDPVVRRAAVTSVVVGVISFFSFLIIFFV